MMSSLKQSKFKIYKASWNNIWYQSWNLCLRHSVLRYMQRVSVSEIWAQIRHLLFGDKGDCCWRWTEGLTSLTWSLWSYWWFSSCIATALSSGMCIFWFIHILILQGSVHYAPVTCSLMCKVKSWYQVTSKQKSVPGILKEFVVFCRLWTPSRQRRIPPLYFLYLLTFSPTSWRLRKLCPNSRYIILSHQYWLKGKICLKTFLDEVTYGVQEKIQFSWEYLLKPI